MFFGEIYDRPDGLTIGDNAARRKGNNPKSARFRSVSCTNYAGEMLIVGPSRLLESLHRVLDPTRYQTEAGDGSATLLSTTSGNGTTRTCRDICSADAIGGKGVGGRRASIMRHSAD